MRRRKIRIEEVYSLENCRKAILNAARHKLKRRNVRKVLENLDGYAVELQKFLMNPQFHSGFEAVKFDEMAGKERKINKPLFFPDHCAHWAVMQVLEPYFRKMFYTYSCSSIKGRGTDYARKAVQRYLKDLKASKYCLQIDIRHYYESIDKDRLVEKLRHKFKDWRVVDLLEKIIRAYPDKGLPLGWYSSAFLANFYLTGLDVFIKSELREKRVVRYMDDVVIFSANKRSLHEDRRRIDEYLTSQGLVMKPNWQVYPMPYKSRTSPFVEKESRRATDFIGFRFFRYKTTIRKRIFKRARRCILHLMRGMRCLSLAHRFFSYYGYLVNTDSRQFTNGHVVPIHHLKEDITHESRRNQRPILSLT